MTIARTPLADRPDRPAVTIGGALLGRAHLFRPAAPGSERAGAVGVFGHVQP